MDVSPDAPDKDDTNCVSERLIPSDSENCDMDDISGSALADHPGAWSEISLLPQVRTRL